MMTEREQTEIWVRAAQRGEQLALAKLLARCHPRLYAWAAARMDASMRARMGPEDILQEVYLDVVRQIGQYEDRGPGSFLAWVAAILNQKLVNARRAVHYQIRDVDREVRLERYDDDSYSNLLDQVYADTGTPSRVIRHEEALGALLVSLAELSEPHRQVLELRFLHGLSILETATRLGKSQAAAVALTQRALIRLRRLMERKGGLTHGP